MPQTLADWLSRLERQHPKAIDLGLDRVRAVHARLRLGRPARQVVTIGGTNGKGSTVAFVESIGRVAGYRVGAYTSPHLLAFNERIRIDGVDVDDASLVEAFEAIEDARGDISLTYFEVATLAALWLFERAGLDLAVLEVGLGGRLDATNIVDADAAIVTTVDLDHQDWLGPDIESIGHEKAGIARAWKPLVLGDDDPPSSVLRHAYAIGARTLRIGCDFFVDRGEAAWRWREVGREVELPLPALGAPAQLRNAAVAIATLRAIDLHVDEEALRRGIATARLPGRLQRIERDGLDYVLDVAHNPQAARQVGAWLAAQPSVHTQAVFAALGDKDAPGIVDALATHVQAWHLAGLPGHGPRATDADTLAARLPAAVADTASRSADVAAALDRARQDAPVGSRILVLGSFHTIADALRHLDGDPRGA
jgi:dihydrofolate synthase/folylpolyglutamate synthase